MNNRKKSEHDQCDKKGFAAIVRAIRAQTTSNRPESKEELQRRDRKHTRIQWIGLIVAAVYAFLTLLLWLQARSANELTRTNLRAAERAYMLLQGATLTSPLVVGQPIRANVVFKNTGRTPAEGIRIGANFYIGKGSGERYPTAYFDPLSQRNDRGSGEELRVFVPRTDEITHYVTNLTPDEWQSLRSFDRVLLLIGEIQYVDVFSLPTTPQTIPDSTTFCSEFRMDESGGGVFMPCGYFHVVIR
jgi:hypothetical protein